MKILNKLAAFKQCILRIIKERYFIVFYQAIGEKGFAYGKVDFTAQHFLNERTALKTISDETGLEKVMITNIIEVSKKELRYWEA